MPIAKKLPSGNWRTRVLIGTDEDGKKHYKSFTAETKKESEFLASQFKMEAKKPKRQSERLFGEVLLETIESKKSIVSPSTYRLYLGQYNGKYFDRIKGQKISSLTDNKVQSMVNQWAEDGLSPKTIRNLYGLFTSAIRTVDKTIVFDIMLPQKQVNDLNIPSSDEVRRLIEASKDTPIELPILLAAHMGLRRSEITALRWSKVDMKNMKLTIDEAMVASIDHVEVSKKPKTSAGKRTIDIPVSVYDALRRHRNDSSDRVVDLTGNAIYKRFERLRDSLGLAPFRFHDLRHYYASVLCQLNVPDKYAMERMGHSTNTVLKMIYQHTMNEKQKEISDSINAFFGA